LLPIIGKVGGHVSRIRFQRGLFGASIVWMNQLFSPVRECGLVMDFG
jgi:hypothetical protein